MKRKIITKLFLIIIGAYLAVPTPLLIAGPNENSSSHEIADFSIVNGKVKISVNFHEPFNWEKTRYESIKQFPQSWIGVPDVPHEIWFRENGEMDWRQTDMMFMSNYTELDEYEIEASVLGYLVDIIGVFNPETNLFNFDALDYVPFFQVPKFTIEESTDLKRWRIIPLLEPPPSEYQWPQELTFKLKTELAKSMFYRLKIEE